MVKFINATVDRPYRVRKHAQACEACRRRKKRCHHLEAQASSTTPRRSRGATSEAADSPSSRATTSLVPRSSGAPSSESRNQVAFGRVLADRDRPIGPSTAARDQQHADTHSSPTNDPRFVGDLNPESTFLADRPGTAEGYTQSNHIGVWVSRNTNSVSPGGASVTPLLQSAISPLPTSHAVENSVSLVPLNTHYDNLKRIYLRDIHPIFPVIDVASLEGPGDTVAQTLAKQAVCLAAGAHPDARPFLTLGDDSRNPMPYSEFSQRLACGMRTALHAGLVKDRLQIIPVLVILSLYTYSSEDRHLPAELAALAVSHAQTVGLHHETPDSRGSDPAYLTKLFCCVWAMDRLNAAFNGRPVLMHDRDFGRDMRACIDGQESGFRLFLENVVLLDRTIQLYRPVAGGTSNEVTESFPTFESLVEKAQSISLETRLLATLELMYHSTTILSCRAQTSSPGLRPPPSIGAQQTLASMSITSIVEDMGDHLPQFTFLPYAVSLSLRVAYREMRSSNVPMLRGRSYRRMQVNVGILRGLRDMFRPALVIVDLVDKLAQEIDKVPPNPPQHDQHGTGPVAESIVVGQAVETQYAPGYRSGQPNTASALEGSQEWQEVAPPMPDLPFPEGLARADLFDFLAPDFDLGAVDAILGDTSYSYLPTFP